MKRNLMRRELTQDEHDLTEIAFNNFLMEPEEDSLDYYRLKYLLRSLGIPSRKHQVIKDIEEYDCLGTGRICLSDFKRLYRDKLNELPKETRIDKSLRNLDKLDTGHLLPLHIRKIASEAKDFSTSEEDFEDIIQLISNFEEEKFKEMKMKGEKVDDRSISIDSLGKLLVME